MRMLNGAVALALLLVPLAGTAQDRELHWPRISVEAHLDSTGKLHVKERQVMQFTGAWNGGERTFNIREGQKLTLERLARLDSATGAFIPMNAGSLENVDDFDWADTRTLRWRSRRLIDPVFDKTNITYLLELTYANILKPLPDSTYLLDHDFAFTEREGVIEQFDLVLTLDPVWRPVGDFSGRYSAAMMPPGNGYFVTLPLTYTGAGRPSAVLFPLDENTRSLIALGFLAGLVAIIVAYFRSQRTLGRFAPLVPAGAITPQWLEQNVFHHLPEVAGAAWDDNTAAPEVAATLARLVQEKKLSSTVETKNLWIFKKDVLHLRMEVPRHTFHAHESELVEALFAPGDDTTDTLSVRKRYQKTGFDPAALIRKRLETVVENTTPGQAGTKPSRRRTLMLLGAAAVLMIAGIVARPESAPYVIIGVLLSAPTFFFGSIVAFYMRAKLDGLAFASLWFILPLGPLFGAYAILILGEDRFRMNALTVAGMGLWLIAIANSLFNIAKSRQSPERIAVRKRLASAREFFRAELRKKTPELRDDWFPYLIAFGLGPHIDKWFRAFGGALESSTRSISTAAAMSAGSASSSTSGSSGWTGFGGGGGFSGAGASATFAAAVGGMAASVPSPSSSSSGGGSSGGGGGSSGGGGGGGW